MHNDTYDAFGRSAAAAADSLGIDNGFVAESVATLPPNASYAVLMPPRSVIGEGKLSEITYDAVPPFMRETLLPRREVDAGSAGYILCYECGQRVRGVRWVWTNDAGDRIGVRR